jgi:hypothetical protein
VTQGRTTKRKAQRRGIACFLRRFRISGGALTACIVFAQRRAGIRMAASAHCLFFPERRSVMYSFVHDMFFLS